VLSNSSLKAIYDQYGYEILKEGLLSPYGKLIGGYRYKMNADEIFEKFFGTNNPFFNLQSPLDSGEIGTMFGSA
jgi:DnaJ family protein B protein 13